MRDRPRDRVGCRSHQRLARPTSALKAGEARRSCVGPRVAVGNRAAETQRPRCSFAAERKDFRELSDRRNSSLRNSCAAYDSELRADARRDPLHHHPGLRHRVDHYRRRGEPGRANRGSVIPGGHGSPRRNRAGCHALKHQALPYVAATAAWRARVSIAALAIGRRRQGSAQRQHPGTARCNTETESPPSERKLQCTPSLSATATLV